MIENRCAVVLAAVALRRCLLGARLEQLLNAGRLGDKL